MTYQFNLQQPSNIIFGQHTLRRISDFISRTDRIAIVCGSKTLIDNGIFGKFSNVLTPDVKNIQIDSHEPTIDSVNKLTQLLKQDEFDKVIGIGGGSTLDSVKAAAALTKQHPNNDVIAFLEGIGEGRPLEMPSLATILIPTTAGTGTEATKNAVMFSPRHQVKKSLRSTKLFPQLVIIDPCLHVTCNRRTTIHSGMDAITQCFESYISCRATAYSRPLSLHGFKLGVENITRVANDPNDLDARTAMAHSAFNSGIALTNAGLGVAHGISAALGTTAGISHGHACAILLPFAAHLNQTHCLPLFKHLAQSIGLSRPDEITEYLRGLGDSFGIESNFSSLGVGKELVPSIVNRSYGNSMSGNPFIPEPEQLTDALIAYYY